MTQSLSRVSTGLRMPFVTAVLPKPTLEHAQWDHGDGTSRALLAWMYAQDILGPSPAHEEIEDGLWKHLTSLIVPETGMLCVPEHSDLQQGGYYYHMWDQGRFFDYMVRRYRHPSTSEARKAELAKRIEALRNGVYSLAIQETLADGQVALKWESDTYWNHSVELPAGRDYGKYNFENWCNVASQMLWPETQWAILTGDDTGIDRAMQLARGFVAGLEAPRRGSAKPTFAEDGLFKGHVHCTLSGLIGLVRLSKALLQGKHVSQAEEWITLAGRVYHWLFAGESNLQKASSCGCVPEGMQLPRYSHESEICCTADTIELAIELAGLADVNPKYSRLSDLWDDVERFTRNELMNAQFTDVSRIEPYLKDSPEQSRDESMRILEKLKGTWVGSRTFLHDLGFYKPSQLDSDYQLLMTDSNNVEKMPSLDSGGCCAYSGIRGLHASYIHAVVQKDTITEVRIPADHVDDNVNLMELPAGGVQFKVHRDCQLRIRKPSYLSMDTMIATNDSASWKISDEGRWITIDVRAGQRGVIKLSQTEWSTQELFGPPNDMSFFADKPLEERTIFTLVYQGNTLVNVWPESKILPYVMGL